MTDLRNLGSIPSSDLTGNVVKYRDCVRIDIAGGSTYRLINEKGGLVADVEGLGSSQTWSEYDFTLSPLSQKLDGLFDVTTLSLAAQDGVWQTLAANPGLRGQRIQVWETWYNPTTGAFDGSYLYLFGQLSTAQCKNRVTVAVNPITSVYSQGCPTEGIGPLCGHIYRDPLTCKFVGSEPAGQTTCDHTRGNGCTLRANLIHWGGYDAGPVPGSTLTVGAMVVTLAGIATAA